MISIDFALGIATGLLAAAGVYLLLRWLARSPSADPWPAGPGPEGLPPPGPDRGGSKPLPAESGTPSSDRVPVVVVGPAPSSPANRQIQSPIDRETRRPAPAERVRLSHRVILHVYSQGTLPAGAVAPLSLCQAGIGEGLGVPQAGLAAVLRRLEASGVLVGERAHVQGRDRRLKVYRLTPRGLELAKALRPLPRQDGPVGPPGRSLAPDAPRLHPHVGSSPGPP